MCIESGCSKSAKIESVCEKVRQDLKAISDKLNRLIENRLLGAAEDGA